MESTPTWEQFKENAAPLERGRNISMLEESFCAEKNNEHRQEFQKMAEQYERLVRPSELGTVREGDDTLIHWLSYIKFHQEAFPSDTQSQFLLLERCTRALLNVKKYSDDVRFIRVCASYADKTQNAGEIFRHMHDQNVGKKTALFWVAWAWWSEKQEDFPFAEKVFKKGISKQAHPLHLLKQRHKQFQRRMSRHWLNSSSRGNEEDEQYDQANGQGRGILGNLSEEKVRRNDRLQNNHRHSNRNGLHSGLVSGSANLTTFRDRSAARNRSNRSAQSNNVNRTAAGFSIFVEDQENLDESFDDRCGAPSHFLQKRQLPREEDKRKENVIIPEPWNERGGYNSSNGNNHNSESSRLLQMSAPFSVYVDESCAAKNKRDEEVRAIDQRRRRQMDERTFREREDGGLAEKLIKDPLRYVKNPTTLAADKKEQLLQTKKDDATKASQSKPRRFKEKHLAAKEAYRQEKCFEESRAMDQCYNLLDSSKNFNHFAVTFNESTLMDDHSMDIVDSRVEGELSMVDVNHLNSEHSPLNRNYDKISEKMHHSEIGIVKFQDDVSFDRNDTSTCSSTVNEASAVGVPTLKEEETINTKLAMKELSMMFSSPVLADSSFRKKDDNGSHLQHLTNACTTVDAPEASFTLMTDVGDNHLDANNSIIGIGDASPIHRADDEYRGARNVIKSSSRTVEGDNVFLQGDYNNTRQELLGHKLQKDHLRPIQEVPFSTDPNAWINHEEGQQQSKLAPKSIANTSQGAFTIFEDNGSEKERSSTALAKDMLANSTKKDHAIYEDNKKQAKSSRKPIPEHSPVNSVVGFKIFEDNPDIHQTSSSFSNLRGCRNTEQEETQVKGSAQTVASNSHQDFHVNEENQELNQSPTSCVRRFDGKNKKLCFQIYEECQETNLGGGNHDVNHKQMGLQIYDGDQKASSDEKRHVSTYNKSEERGACVNRYDLNQKQAGVQIYDENQKTYTSVRCNDSKRSRVGFKIFEDMQDTSLREENHDSKHTQGGFQIFEDNQERSARVKTFDSEHAQIGFRKYEEKKENNPKSAAIACIAEKQLGRTTREVRPRFDARECDRESGCESTQSLDEEFGMGLKVSEDKKFMWQSRAETTKIQQVVNDEESDVVETASLSLFGDTLKVLNDLYEDEKSSTQTNPDTTNAIANEGDNSPSSFASEERIICNVIDYFKAHKADIKSAFQRLQISRCPRIPQENCLRTILTKKNAVYNATNNKFPRKLKNSSNLIQASEIKIGLQSTRIKRVLGKGTYGIVVLLDEKDKSDSDQIAVKAQSPTGCLAWEYEILRKIEERLRPEIGVRHALSTPFPFPRAYAFAALSDGAFLSMTPGSCSGLNLVDVVNVYKVALGEKAVPEIIALHYTARMLKHLVSIHLHGKILHCDIKPDNWVLMASRFGSQGCTSSIDGSDLMLTDFGRAVDLTELATKGSDVMKVKLYGEATGLDMKCVAMRSDSPWSFDVDTYGVCASVNVLLFGQHLDIMLSAEGRWKPRQQFRRYWQTQLWRDIFDVLLNVDDGSGTAIGSHHESLRTLQGELEVYLNGQKDKLEIALKRQARALPQSKKIY